MFCLPKLNGGGYGPLHVAAEWGLNETVDFLVSRNANIDASNQAGKLDG